MRHVLSILFGAGFTVAACWSAGKLALARLKLDVSAGELQLFRFMVGAALFSLIIFGLAACGLAREWVFLVVGFSLIALALRVRETRTPLPDFATGWKLLFAGVLLVYGIFYFVNALAPEASPDGSTYHLGLVARYLRQHGFGHITTNFYANLSEGVEMLFLNAFAFGRHSAAALVEFSFLMVLPAAMLAYSRRFGFPKAGVAASVIVFTSPVFGISGTSAYNDAAAACVLFCLFYALQIWDSTRQRGMLIIAGLLAGFSYGIKYTLFLAAPYAALFVIWKLYRKREAMLRPMLLLSGCATLMILPWWVKNLVLVGNPFSPFANAWFPNPYVSLGFEQEYARLMKTGISWAQRPLQQTVGGGMTGGLLGAVFLLSPLGLLALRYRQGRQILLAAAIFLIPAFTNRETRFLMLCAPFVALAMGLAVMQSKGAALLLTLAAMVTNWPSFVDSYCDSYAWRLTRFPVAEALRLVPESVSLSARIELPLADMINRLTPNNARILSFTNPPEAYIGREVLVAYESALGDRLRNVLFAAVDPEYAPNLTLTFSFPAQPVRGIRVVQTANAPDEQWSVAELRLMSKGKELPRNPDWRLRACPNPWDVQLAFDNNPATRWSSNQPLYNGMLLHLELGRPQVVNAVVLECSHNQYSVRIKLELEGIAGAWRTVAEAPKPVMREPDWNLRRAAIEDLKARGITHLLIADGDLGSADFARNPDVWGIRLLGQAGDKRLFALQ